MSKKNHVKIAWFFIVHLRAGSDELALFEGEAI